MLDTGDSTVGADLAEMIGPGNLSATSLPLLGMGRDIPDGVMRLVGGPARGRLDDRDLDRLLRGRARHDAHDRGPARRHLLRQPGLVGQARDHRAPARRRADGTPPGRGSLRPVRRGVRPPGPLRDGRGAAARPCRRQPVADHRRRRRPCLHPPARVRRSLVEDDEVLHDRRRVRDHTPVELVETSTSPTTWSTTSRRSADGSAGERAAVHRADEGLRGARRRRPPDRPRAGSLEQGPADVRADDLGRRRRPVRGRAGPPGVGDGLRRLRPPRRPARCRARLVQPVRARTTTPTSARCSTASGCADRAATR